MKIIVPLLALGLAGCGSLLHGEDPQAVVNQRLIGMPIGDFSDHYGMPRTRAMANDGTHSFDWDAAPADAKPGASGGDYPRCGLHLTSAKDGRIVAATITRDDAGQRHTSRCVDIFG